jgi:hypothetical protein
MDSKYQCETCEKTYKSELYLTKHKCSGLKTITKCQYCDKPFSRLYYKNSHEEKCTNTIGRNDFTPNNYGYENIEYITTDQLIELISKRVEGIIKMILMKHFNHSHPENQNVVILGENCFVYRNDKWNKINRDSLVNDLYYDGINSIDTLYEEALENNKPMKVKERDIEFLKYDYEDESLMELNKEKIEDFLDKNRTVIKINKTNGKLIGNI